MFLEFSTWKSEACSDKSHALHKLLGKLSQIKAVCTSCKHSPCLRGEIVIKENFVQKSRVKLRSREERNKNRVHDSNLAVVKVEGDSDNEEFEILGYICEGESVQHYSKLSDYKYDCIG